MGMKLRHKYLIYASLAFLAIALYKANYLELPQVSSFLFLILSCLLLFVSFLLYVISWQQTLKHSGYDVGLRECLAGTGLSIFGKYVPGKVWIIVGRAAYITEARKYPLSKLTAISLNAQFLALWVGLIIGVIGLFFVEGPRLWAFLALFAWLLLTGVTFSRIVHDMAEYGIRKVLRKEVEIPSINPKQTLLILPWFAMYWIAMSIAFYLLVVALSGTDTPLSVGLGFPLAGTLGVMAVISPGGLGVREGILVGFMTLAGISLKKATTISVAARLWFLLGEAFIFFVGMAADKWKNRK